MKKTILLIDDRRDNLFVLEEVIKEHLPDCMPIIAVGGKEGLTRVASDIDLVISDLQMPELSGIDVCRAVKANSMLRHIPFLLITANQSSPELRVQGLEAGAMDFISRPIDTKELVAKINVALRLQANAKGLRNERDTLAEKVEATGQQLMVAEKRYKILFESATDSILVVSFNGEILEANVEAHRMLGYKRRALVGTPLQHILLETERSFDVEQLPASGVASVKTTFIRVDNSEVPVEVRSRLVDFGDEQAILLFARDIT